MKITGYRIREALRRWQLRRDAAHGQFQGTLLAFPGEDKPSPDKMAETAMTAETAIARLQVAQTRYNLAVTVSVEGLGTLTLLDCVKRVGGLGRIEKLWRSASTVKEDRYGGYTDRTVRDKDQVVAVRVISLEEAGKRTTALDKTLGALREAIAVGNARDVELEDLDATLFE